MLREALEVRSGKDAAPPRTRCGFRFSPARGRDVTVVGDREGLETLRGAVGAMDGELRGVKEVENL